MSCPTCDHTMESVCDGVFWCPRCGTLKSALLRIGQTPKLVERCRKFGETLGTSWGQLWVYLGIAEGINLPSERQQQEIPDCEFWSPEDYRLGKS